MGITKKLAIGVLAVVGMLWAAFLLIHPSNERDWSIDQAILPYVEINGDLVAIHNIRNFTYISTTNYEPHYYDKTVDISTLESVYFMVEPLGKLGAAHTLLSYGFEDGTYISISVEIRKEKGEKFSVLKGLFKQYELMYVIADEHDIIKLRTNYRNDSVYLYPINASKEKIQQMFLQMVMRANKLKGAPEFYNTLTSTCTTNIVEHVNTLSPRRVPFSLKVLFPAHAGEFAYNLGLINTNLSYPQAQHYYYITSRANLYPDYSYFSHNIRNFGT